MRRTKEEAEQTKLEILSSATKLFSDKGVAKTTLDEIATAAGVTRGAIYWHFKNKTEIFDALHEQLHRPLLDMIMQDLEKNHPEPLTQLKDLCVKLLLDLEENEQKRRSLCLFIMKCDYADELAPYKEKHRAKKQENMKLFCKYFEKAKKQGKLPHHADPSLLTLSLNCYLKGIIFEYFDNPDGFDMRKQAPVLMEVFFNPLNLIEPIQ